MWNFSKHKVIKFAEILRKKMSYLSVVKDFLHYHRKIQWEEMINDKFKKCVDERRLSPKIFPQEKWRQLIIFEF